MTEKTPYGLILTDYDIDRSEVISRWIEATDGGPWEKAQIFPVTTQDVANLGGDRKISVIVIAFTRFDTNAHRQVLERTLNHYRGKAFVYWTKAAGEALRATTIKEAAK